MLAQKGIKKKWLAQQVGVSSDTIRMWCSGNRMPSMVTAHKVAYILDVDVKDIWVYEK